MIKRERNDVLSKLGLLTSLDSELTNKPEIEADANPLASKNS